VRRGPLGRRPVTAVAAPPGAVQFLVVGSPRSGTTVVQRLACEIPGVGMPPETHFFARFALDLLARHRFPLSGPELADAVAAFARSGPAPEKAVDGGAVEVAGLDVAALDVAAVVADLGGTCRRPLELFDAVVRQLAGPAEVLGEKTPNHLVWWRPISVAAPWMRFVVVVRDPRAVVASNLDMPWRTDATLPAWGDHIHLAFAMLWSFFQGQALRMSHELGPRRCLVLRYEDVVREPDAVRLRLASFLERPLDGAPEAAPSSIVLPWETWKARALEPVDDRRVASWRDRLSPRVATEITVVCASRMRTFGYDRETTPVEAARAWLGLGPRNLLRLARYARGRRAHLRAIERCCL
jgi:hypothetical protein